MGMILIALRRYYRDEYRRQINAQLNKRRSPSRAAKYLFVANKAQIINRHARDQLNQAS
ncbi:hypothetical protein BH18ACI4_BH18ACI4_01930 [soil metagenome]